MAAGVYLHIPFCRSRCSYCDFATNVYRSGEAVERYVNALCSEVEAFAVGDRPPAAPTTPPSQSLGYLFSGRRGDHGSDLSCRSPHVSKGEIDTIYFGGGTPSLLSPAQVRRILASVRETFSVDPSSEITMEMNPATVTPESLAAYKILGVNRASFGVQTFNDHSLRLLARGHTADDARNTFRMLREAGFENISFDLIAGLPRQTLSDWERNLDEALRMGPEHLSLYLLEIHEGTPLAEQVQSRRQPMPDEELAAEMYELMLERVTSAGYRQYEISNFARPGFESRHNTKYWRLDPVFGFGVSAHSFDGTERYANERDTLRYISRIEGSLSAEVMRESVNAASEYAFLALRMTDGIDLTDYRRRFETDLETKYAPVLERLEALGLIETYGGRLHLTSKGMLFSNEVFAAFV